MPKYPLTPKQNAELINLLADHSDFFHQLFSLSFVRNMRENEPQIKVADENRLKDFLKVLQSRFNANPDDDPYLAALITIDTIRAEIKNRPAEASDLHRAALYSFKGNIMNREVHLRTDLEFDRIRTDPEGNEIYKTNLLTEKRLGSEQRENFFEATKLGSIIAKLLLDQSNKESLIQLAKAFAAQHPTVLKTRAANKVKISNPRINLMQTEITANSPGRDERDAMLKAFFSNNTKGKLIENDELYKKWILPLINNSNSTSQEKFKLYQTILAATVYRLWMRKFLASNPSLHAIHEELHRLISNKVAYMNRVSAYNASDADKFSTQMVKLLLDATKKFGPNQADIALIQAMASWSSEERAYITKQSALRYDASLNQWEFFPAPSYSGSIGVNCKVTDKDGQTVTLTRKHVIIEDFVHDENTNTYTPTKVTSFMTSKDAHDKKLLHHLMVAKDMLREHTRVFVPKDSKGKIIDPESTPIDLRDILLIDYIPDPAEFNANHKAVFGVAVYDPDTPKNVIARRVSLPFIGVTSIPVNMTIPKANNIVSFNIHKLLGISSEKFSIESPGIDPAIGALTAANANGDVTLTIQPPQPGFKERNRITDQDKDTHNFNAGVDLIFKIISKADETKKTNIALNVPLADLQDPAVTTLKPRLKFIVSKDLLQKKLYEGLDFKTELELVQPRNVFSPNVIEVAEFVDKKIAEFDQKNHEIPITSLISHCSSYISEVEQAPKNLGTNDIDSAIEDLKTYTLNAALMSHLIEQIETKLHATEDVDSALQRDFEDLKYRSDRALVALDKGQHRKLSL